MKNEQITFRQSLFWDVDPKTIDIEKNARYIIERILDFGDDNEVRWMWNRYNHALIRDVVDRSRGLFPATRSFWNLMLST
ncbi:MAG: hypothetical protein A3C08_03560 [Candidatus Taylorbacteria bacterium RIFCSPHIGHO2_02_FULL_47_18]|uniref:DUF6922 domain-containing protein n=1 Tax=Candidatus Taylorbacteria bacterium RIFCSPLOWO2_01_FULL_48_100 TaxID=1802322 RepID=A0A1G2NCY5_9BACT|nr:MAG: hypothetical protein A2670_00880 [Candidatus Taylorbacteria bacterium RIFCSPHIGHO2_01_FULL_48_38]OHA28210.1 MAG: hypothetical protein A3C08_03560 [Candidatus Taylorbacteria bacterium RIFCSPHIGHO2_02_FULL_47_18]OHA33903.1 MAG: hypothetical protein A2938_02670 [Candidatus Taylorbacteria bacterium RIFCSPLOWO2_01_FULL_48_100]OHA40878.1 MAG: hypothetical protein A3J31_03680 [Candidatus Taylorbacteria bacterium RIFCSPLOWO2_02_FULL_48_16]OHA45110.1 MAG: hypothetical protein A3H13_02905 [Candid